MSETAWLVTAGDYSDYSVLGVFTDKALLDAYVALAKSLGQGEPRVEEMPLNPAREQIEQQVPSWYVRMAEDGSAEDCTAYAPSLDDGTRRHWTSGWAGTRERRFTCWVVARDRETAIKAANEYRLASIANRHVR